MQLERLGSLSIGAWRFKCRPRMDLGPPYEGLSDAIVITFDPKIVAEKDLIKHHLLAHSSQFQHKSWAKNRSAIYVFSKEQFIRADKIVEHFQKEFKHNLITRILTFATFKTNEPKFLNYFQKNPNASFSRDFIQPKLDILENLIKRKNAKLG